MMPSIKLPRATWVAMGLPVLLLLAGCATSRDLSPDPRDPLERVNRVSFAFNEGADRWVAKPAAEAYQAVTPQFVETGVSNFYRNLLYPRVVINDLLQGKPGYAASGLTRFVVNSTLGLGGLLDPAASLGLALRDEDFGQTLGVWGISSGPYLVLPLLGPSSARDAVGRVADEFTEPPHYLKDDRTRIGLTAGRLLDRRARLLSTDRLLERAADKYTFVRSAYLQREAYLVSDGEIDVPPADEPSELEPEDY